MLCLITPITSPRVVINQQQSAFSRPWTLCQSGSRRVSGRSFRADRSTTRRYSHLPACLPLSSEIADGWAACAEHKGSSAVHSGAAYFETMAAATLGLDASFGNAQRTSPCVRIRIRSCVVRMNHHQQRR